MKSAIRIGGNHAVHEAKEFDATATLCVRHNDFSGSDLKRRKQCRCAMPLVIVALAGQGPAVRQLQIALRPLQRLDRKLFVGAKNNRLVGVT